VDNEKRKVLPFSDVRLAMAAVDSFTGDPEDFVLAVSECLLDPMGVNMALITDRVLARKWEPKGFEQRPGLRLYRYKKMR
jgi:hypothetical protein